MNRNYKITDRRIPPPFQTIKNVEIKDVTTIKFPNGIPFYYINSEHLPIIKLEIVFEAGSWKQTLPLVAGITGALLNEGTKSRNSVEIAQMLDYWGSYIYFDSDKHYSTAGFFTLEKYIEPLLELFDDMVKNSILPEKEFKIINDNKRQDFAVELEKVENKARAALSGAIFGEKHPYGNQAKLSDFDNPNLLNSCREFYRKYYNSANCKIVASGKITENVLKKIETYFGTENWGNATENQIENPKEITQSTKTKIFIPKKDAPQAAVRIGKPTINLKHEDYFGLSILNDVLGGYFGSRLMANIREEKGLTYDINSYLISLKYSGFFVISTNIAINSKDEVLKEIYKEIAKLREELIPTEELALVKNFMTGEMLRDFDGPFAIADATKFIIGYDLDLNYYRQYNNAINNIQPHNLRELANRYFQENSFFEVIAGG